MSEGTDFFNVSCEGKGNAECLKVLPSQGLVSGRLVPKCGKAAANSRAWKTVAEMSTEKKKSLAAKARTPLARFGQLYIVFPTSSTPVAVMVGFVSSSMVHKVGVQLIISKTFICRSSHNAEAPILTQEQKFDTLIHLLGLLAKIKCSICS